MGISRALWHRIRSLPQRRRDQAGTVASIALFDEIVRKARTPSVASIASLQSSFRRSVARSGYSRLSAMQDRTIMFNLMQQASARNLTPNGDPQEDSTS